MAEIVEDIIEHEVEVTLLVTTSRKDITDALTRSGVRDGELIGEALITSVTVYTPEDEPYA